MKWWYGLIILVGVVLGLFLFNKSKIENQKGGRQKQQIQITSDVEGKPVETSEVFGVVEEWDYNSGKLTLREEQSAKEWLFILEPSQTTIFIPSLQNKGQILKVSNKTSERWKTAFCKGDFVTVKAAEEKAVAVDNGGYRSCGFKGE